MGKIERVILCSCEGSMQIDPESAAASLKGAEVITASHLCTTELGIAETALGADGTSMIACGQMTALFDEIAVSLGAGERFAIAPAGRKTEPRSRSKPRYWPKPPCPGRWPRPVRSSRRVPV